MNNYYKFLSPLGIIVFVLSLFTGCKEEDNLGDNNDKDSKLEVQVVSNTNFGDILVNQENQSLYFFAGDVTGISNCNGGCADVWPPLIGEVYELNIDADLHKDDFSTITRKDGQKQITYKGWPLYYFSPEGDGIQEAPGEILGDGRGGVFHVAKPDYTLLVGRQAVSEGADPVVYLVDDRGVSLYRSLNDDENVSNCAGGCAGVWPPFKAQATWVVPSSLNPEDFTSVNREDELGPQLAYQGNPLYYFTPDEQVRGNVLGQGGAGETFFVVEPASQP